MSGNKSSGMSDKPQRKDKNARREQMAAQRARQEAKDERQRRLITGIGIVIVVLLVVGVGIAVQSSRNDTTDAALPATVSEPGGPIVRNPNATGLPVLDYWEDFQCPACRDMEEATGATIRELVETDQAIVRYNILSFLDGRLGNDSSSRAANAFACSADAGQQGPYHDAVFANQPAEEGVGYTDEQLIQFGTDVGITGAEFTTFQECVEGDTYGDYVTSVATAGAQASINSTPSVFLDGTQLPQEEAFDPAALSAAVTEASAG